MRNKIIGSLSLVMLTLAVGTVANAQRHYESDFIERRCWSLGMNVGSSDLWGDIGTKSPVAHFSNSNYGDHARPFAGMFARYTFHPSVAFRAGFNYGLLSAGDNMNVDLAKKADKYESDEVQRYQRNLDVRVTVMEANLLLEINPLRFSINTRGAQRSFQPYLLTGITGYNFVSKGRYIERDGSGGANTGQYINLYDLHVEGDGLEGTGVKKYSQYQIAIPLGIGGKWDLSPKMAIGIEFLYRKCMTDYLDGVSGKYLDPKYYSAANGYTAYSAKVARAMSDKSWELDEGKVHAPGQMRGNGGAKKDAYSTISITLFYKFRNRAYMWWR